PLIGNYGVNSEDAESRRPFVEGFVVREYSEIGSNWRSGMSLDVYLKSHGIVGISEIDTRALVRHIRDKGAMRACISAVDLNEGRLIEKARTAPQMIGRNLVDEVTCGDPYDWESIKDQAKTLDPVSAVKGGVASALLPDEEPFRVVAYDFGIK